jgi:hypothetical protein
MSYSEKIEIISMAFSHSAWIDKARNRMEGALGEYAKLRYARLIDFHYDWAPEVKALVKKVQELFNPERTKVKTKFDLDKAFLEAYDEASMAQEQLVSARTSFERGYLRTPKEVQYFLKQRAKNRFTSEALLKEMLQEFAPDLLDRIKLK